MAHDFDQHIDRHLSDSIKWHYYDKDVLPLWLADMDFKSPDPVIRALHERVEHGVFGYGMAPPELREVIVERLHRRYDWEVSPEALVFLPGVVTGFNLACHAVTSPGDGVLIQTPAYWPILSAPAGAGLTNDEMELTRAPDGRYGIDSDAFEKAITGRTRIFISCNPHNFFLQQAKVAVADGAIFGRGGEGFVRLNFGCPRSILTEALDKMKEALLALK